VSDNIQIVAHVHPFAPQDRILKQILPGKSIEEIIPEVVKHRVGRIIVAVDGELITDYKYIPKPGANMVVRVVPAGGDTQENLGKAGGWTSVAGWAMIIVGGLTGQGWLVGLGAATLLSGVALVGSSILMDAFTPGSGAPRSETLPSIRGGRNRANPWGKVPCVFGTHLIQPMYAAKSYTSIDGTDGVDMYLHTIMAVSAHARTGGNVLVSDIKVGETILATNAANEINNPITVDGPFTATAQVYNNGTNPSLFPEIVLEDSPGVELDSDVPGDNMWRSTAPGTTKVSIDITLPRGLFSYNSDGAQQNHSVTVTVKRRVTGSGTAWAAASTVNTFSLTKSITKTARYNFTETVASGQYDYALTRSANDASDFKGTSLTQWSAFRSIKSGVRPIDATVQAGICILAIKIKATADLQGTVDQINCIAKQSVPIYSGGNWSSFGYSENPAALYLAALRGPMGQRPVADALIDWTTIQSWYTTCATKGWTCNFVLSSGTRLRDILSTIAQTGRASMTLRDGLYSAVVDESKSTVIQHFAARNVRNFTWQKAFRDRPHALKINYINAADGYAPAERIVYDDGYTIANATKFEQVQLAGVTSADLAFKHGRYLLAVSRLRPEVYSFETDAEGIIAEPGDLVRIAHDSIAVGLISSRIKSVAMSGVNATAITIDELCRFEAGKSYAVRMRLTSDNSTVYAAINNAAGTESNTLTFTVAVATIPAIGDLVLFGEASIESLEALIVGVEAGEDLGCRLFATDRADAVHTADSGAIPAYDSKVSRPPQIGQSTAPATVISAAVKKVVESVADTYVSSSVIAAAALAEADAAQTAASDAQGDATEALNDIATIVDDDKLSIDEKPWVVKEHAEIIAEQSGIGTKLISYSLTALKTAYDNAITALTNYLATLTSPVLWNNYTDYTTIVRTTFTAKFQDVYTARQNALNALYTAAQSAAEAAAASDATNKANAALAAVPVYKGAYLYASGPGSANENDIAVLYSSTLAERGVYRWESGTWAKQTGPTVAMLSLAWPDISRATIAVADGGFSGGPYGEIADYIGTGANVFEVLAVQTAFINKLMAKFLKVSASLRGGDRYDEDGTTIDGTKLGFFFSGLTGGCKVAGIEFEGDLNGGVQWGRPVQVGSDLTITSLAWCSITALGGSNVVVADTISSKLKCFRFKGSSWVSVGTDFTITGMGEPAISALNATDIAYYDGTIEQLRTYRFNGSTWSQVGTGLSIPGLSFVILAAMNGTDIALYKNTYGSYHLQAYRFNGSSWAELGSYLNVGFFRSSATMLNSVDIVLASGDGRVYRFNGSTWSQVGSASTLAFSSDTTVSALNGSDIAVIDHYNETLSVYRFNGSIFSKIADSGDTGIIASSLAAMCTLNGTDVAVIDSTSDKLRLYRFSFSISRPYSRTLTG